MVERIVYLLTKYGFIKWKKRFFAENLIGSFDRYYYSNKYLKIRLGQSHITYPQTTSLHIFSKKTNKAVHVSVSTPVIEELVSFLDKQKIDNYYITEHSIKLTNDIVKQRQLRILLITKKIEVI